MDWIKKHVDTVIILSSFAASMLWMNGKFNEIDMKFKDLDKEIAVLKAVLIMRNIMPVELAKKEDVK